MILMLRALLFVGGLFFVLMGIGFLLDPVGSGANFGIAPQGTMGMASIRADMTAFFIVAGGCLIWGAYARKGDPLLVSAALMAIALVGRVVTLIADGPHDLFWQPMLVEAVTVIVALICSRVLPHTSFEGED
ncbi:DUF4345 domain-containing protein [Altererythrobacter sp. BO-6]|uniref:DUF4345 family protein n=1 Tax=Altererythrobacter sp. BO-6 TaxID=2604537 RepID=UPI0013E1D0BE|nr:DUF4345 family protein [Altererythrobacter sp. BO-6]QIG53872.1 DUF4345 domain-containing protein [Altererythrobacter sp. BO-6]